MKRIDIFQNEDKSFNTNFFIKAISSWLNEEITIENAPKGSRCINCFWHGIDNHNILTCNAPLYYIGMQVCDCSQYKPIK